MKHHVHIRRALALLLCTVMLMGLLPTSAFAAKEMFMQITQAG